MTQHFGTALAFSALLWLSACRTGELGASGTDLSSDSIRDLALPPTCDLSHTSINGRDSDRIEEGSYCDTISLCVRDQKTFDAVAKNAPHFECVSNPALSSCQSGLSCTWNRVDVRAGELAEICAVTALGVDVRCFIYL